MFLYLTRYSELTLMALSIANHNATLSADHFGSEIYSKSFVLYKSVLIEI